MQYHQSKSVNDYILSRITIGDGCWEWQGYRDRNGYGRCIGSVWYERYHKSGAHQLAYIAFIGEIPEGMFVCHSCDNPSCCRPSHLWLGTVADNNKDMIKKKRGRYPGPRKRKLTQSAVDFIRSQKGIMTCLQLGKLYDVSYSNICFIWRGDTWR